MNREEVAFRKNGFEQKILEFRKLKYLNETKSS